uniref:Uncharacterized protein n=1 Tax=Nelumbo nucifera TaxID=4432 RepID=A0A822XR58_NELNU|nr:TPA_asm: hypothetical protein HUJ06_023052 [Nelumbo nucifera]
MTISVERKTRGREQTIVPFPSVQTIGVAQGG